MTPEEEARYLRRYAKYKQSLLGTEEPVPVAAPAGDVSVIDETLKGLVSGGTGEISDLIAKRALGTDALDPNPNSYYPYHAGYILGSLLGAPQMIGMKALGLAGRVLPKAGLVGQAALAGGASNAALTGISAAGQGEDVVDAVKEGGVLGAALGALGAKVGPRINEYFGGRKVVPTAAKAADSPKPSPVADSPPVAGLPPRSASAGEEVVKKGRTYQQAIEDAELTRNPPPFPSYTVLTPDSAAKFDEITAQNKILSDLFPGDAPPVLSDALPVDVPVPFTVQAETTISKWLGDRYKNEPELAEYGQKYLSALMRGVEPKAKDFPRPKGGFQQAVKKDVDEQYKAAVQIFNNRINAPPTVPPKAPPPIAADILEPAPIAPELPPLPDSLPIPEVDTPVELPVVLPEMPMPAAALPEPVDLPTPAVPSALPAVDKDLLDVAVRKEIKSLDYMKKSVGLKPDAPFTAESIRKRLALEQEDNTEIGALESNLERILQIADRPEVFTLLSPPRQKQVKDLAETWRSVSAGFDQETTRAQIAASSVEKQTALMQAKLKDPNKVALQLVKKLHTKTAPDTQSTAVLDEATAELTTSRVGGIQGGKLGAEHTAALSKQIELLVGPDKARQLLDLAYNAPSADAITSRGMAILKGTTEAPVVSVGGRRKKLPPIATEILGTDGDAL